VDEGASLVVDGRGQTLQGYENGFFVGASMFDQVTTDMEIYRTEIFGPVLSVMAPSGYDEAVQMINDHEYGNGVAIFTRDGDTARHFSNSVDIGMVGVNVPIPVPMAFQFRRRQALQVRRHPDARPGIDPLLHQDEDDLQPLAVGHQGRRATGLPDEQLRPIH
jgi:acyl-CoA reductase-like NAD-dependent aldehyde dehydrogenase